MSMKSWLPAGRRKVVGVDIGPLAVRLVQLSRDGRGSFCLDHLGMEPLPPNVLLDGKIVGRKAVAKAVERLFRNSRIRTPRVVASIGGHSVIVKTVSLPVQSREELEEAIQWEAEQYIPFDISEIQMDYQVLRKVPGESRMEVLLVAVKREQVDDCRAVFAMANQKLALLDIDVFALQNVFEVNYRPDAASGVALLHVGNRSSNLTVRKGTQFLFTRDIEVGVDPCTKARCRDSGESEGRAGGQHAVETFSNPRRAIALEASDATGMKLASEVEETLDFFRAKMRSVEVRRIYLCGGSVENPALRRCLRQRLKIPTDRLNPFRRIEVDQLRFPRELVAGSAAGYAVSVGLALRF